MTDVNLREIPGTVIFDGAEAQKGYALNKMCYSFNRAENRAAFTRDEDSYCRAYGLTTEQRDAVRRRDVLALVHAGGNVYYLAKLTGIFGLGVQDIGAQQTGVTVEEFRARLRAAGVREWLAKVDPAAVVMIYNDHGLNFFLDKMPTFAIGAAPEYRNDDEGWGLPTLPPFPGDPKFSWHVIESLVADEFDVTTCQEMLVDHAFTVPISLLWPERSKRRFRTLPVAINTVQHPLPTPARCYALGQAIGRAIESYPEDIGVVVVATGGMSHQLDGERAGFINKAFDQHCLEMIVENPRALAEMSIHELVRAAGTQGVELIMWLAARGALGGKVKKLHGHYHIPVSNTAAGLLLLDRAA